MSATMIANGRPRKQLADQLDRLDAQMDRQDGILDGLSEALNEAVHDASKEGVKEAVTSAVIELLTNIELRTALHKATAPPVDATPSLWQRLKVKMRQGVDKVKHAASTVRAVITGKVAAVKSAASGASTPAWIAWRLRKVVMVALAIGVVAATVSYLSAHGVAAVLSGLGAATTAVAVQAGLWVRKTIRRLAMV